MIARQIPSSHIGRAIRRIHRDSAAPRRKSRGYCPVSEHRHLPPKYTIALAHQAATGESLSSNRFSEGAESNDSLESPGLRGIRAVAEAPFATADLHPKRPNPNEAGA